MLHLRLFARRPSRQIPALRLLLAAAVVLSAAAFQAPTQTASAAPGPGDNDPTKPEPKPDTRANILLITTDDQTLADLRYMRRTRRLIAGHGVTFDGISPHPLCCPARAEMLTGQFAQNNDVRSNLGLHGGYRRLRRYNTVGRWLNRAGYHTVFMGKYLNGYGPRSDNGPAPGWDDWNPTVGGVYNFHGYRVRHNRRLQRYQTYQTDFFTNLAVRKIREASQRREPFFLWQSYMAPHLACPPSMETARCWAPPKPAARHRGMFRDVVPPSIRSEAFNEADLSDKPYPLVNSKLLDDEQVARIHKVHRARLQSLQAVDEGVATMLDTLRRTGELRNTLIVFTSDNGYLLGEHRHMGKVLPYEPSLQVPVLMRGPGVPQGVVRDRVATPVDFAPTFTEVADARAGLVMDGRNLLPIARRNAASWENLLIQAGPYRPWNEPDGWFYRGVRTDRYTYAYYLYSDEEELYDRRHDPDQLQNLAGDPRYRLVLRSLRRQTETLRDCAGWECRQSFRPVPGPLDDAPQEATSTTPTEPAQDPPTATTEAPAENDSATP
ncbi:MAG: sulfatase [Actinomycetota bacterium]|nr:sulfatase [Actinomycetota bacterium]